MRRYKNVVSAEGIAKAESRLFRLNGNRVIQVPDPIQIAAAGRRTGVYSK
jgi:hypothetical protein